MFLLISLQQIITFALLVVWVASRASYVSPTRGIHPLKGALWIDSGNFQSSKNIAPPVVAFEPFGTFQPEPGKFRTPFKKRRANLSTPLDLNTPRNVPVPHQYAMQYGGEFAPARFRNGFVFQNVTTNTCILNSSSQPPDTWISTGTNSGVVSPRGVYSLVASTACGRRMGCRIGTLDSILVQPTREQRCFLNPDKAPEPCLRTLTGHTIDVTSVALDAGVVVSGSGDNTIKVWDRTNNYALIKTLTGHNSSVSSVALDAGVIVSGAGDNTIKVWDCTNNYALIKTLTGHTSSVSSVALDAGVVVSGSGDNTIKVWNHTNNYTLIKNLTGHTRDVSSVALDAGIIVSGSDDNTIKVWNRTNNYNLIKTLTGHTNTVSSVALDAGIIVSGAGDNTIKVWDRTNNYNLITTLTGHSYGVYTLALDAGVIVSGDGNNTIKVWDRTNNYNLVKTLIGHTDDVLSVALGSGVLVSSSYDKTIKVWNRDCFF
jgi:WD40 repeat protein